MSVLTCVSTDMTRHTIILSSTNGADTADLQPAAVLLLLPNDDSIVKRAGG